MNPTEFDQIERLFIRSANWVGDAIMTTPAIATIRHNFPHAHITLLAKPWVIPVFTNNPHIDAIMVYENSGRHHGHMGVWRLARDLRKHQFELAILLQNAFEAALIAWLAKIPRRLGFTTDARGLLLTDRIRTWPKLKQGHLIDYYLGLLASAGMMAEKPQLRLYLTPREKSAAKQMLSRLGIPPTTPVVGINPGATYGTAKRWPADRYVALSRRLIQTREAMVLVFGGPGEARLGEAIARNVGHGCFNLCNRTNLREAMALIDCCRLFVTNDSGLMHVAAALDVPQVAIIGPTDPVATGPVNRASRTVQVRDSCDQAPCLKQDCPIDHRCMTAIDVEAVLETIDEMLHP